ncbi:hypothetical protein [Pseudomonas typographi]|uniref:Lipoprotein n=1 Tax=Pseudomonas typographi TaxID=2715964 RepID=A0ABR7Z153_9PSED|nr:hypothetical protein [Pseudomonas typographi]MBD1551764.1 hypothetical protein [Pseudomonas typographi]MBD1599221.1 hypothetical protein [Pseudomonas typographi]
MKKHLISLTLTSVLAAMSLGAMAAQPDAGASNTPEHNTGNPSTQANPSSKGTGGNGGASIPDPQQTPAGHSKATKGDASAPSGSGAVGGNSQGKGSEKQE